MARYIRTGFAGTVLVGPIVLAADATAATGLTITQAQTRLSKNGGDPAQKHEATSASHNENGYYDVTLDATDTGTVGELRMMIVGTAALSYVVDFTVLSTAVYDWLFGTVAPSVVGDIMKVSSGTGANQISLSSGVAAASVAAVGTPVALDGGTATIAGMLTKLADDNGGATFDATVSSQDKINTRLPAALTANGNIKASLMEILATALTETAGLIAAAFKNFFNVATPTGTVNSLPAATPTAGALITAGTGTAQLNVASGKVPATVAAGDVADLLLLKTLVQYSGTAQGAGTGNNQIQLQASGKPATNSLVVGSVVVLTGGTGAGQARRITAYTASTAIATVDRDWITNPSSDTTFLIVGLPALTAQDSADALKLAPSAGAPAAGSAQEIISATYSDADSIASDCQDLIIATGPLLDLLVPAVRTISAAEDVVIVKNGTGTTLATFTKTAPGGVETWTKT